MRPATITRDLPSVANGRRLNPRNAESVRQRIRVAQLCQRLENHGLGKTEMSATQIDAAKFLINKAMPNPPTDNNVNLSGQGKFSIEVIHRDAG